MFWGCFSSKGPGPLVGIHGIMDSIKYQQILNLNRTASVRKLKLGRGWIFQQDNDPKHISKSTQKCFTDHIIKVLPWPSQSPDLNPIENLWDELMRRIHKRGPQNLKDLERLCMEEWSQIPCHVFSNLITHDYSTFISTRNTDWDQGLCYSWALRIHVYTFSLGTMIKKLHKTIKTITDNTNKYNCRLLDLHIGYSPYRLFP